jgi:UDP-glucose 4-epimerase
MSKSLVTGGAGFVGSHLVDALLEGGHEVVIYDNFGSGRHNNIPRDTELIEGDIRDQASLRKAMGGVEFVFHEAALTSVPRSIEDPLTFAEVNELGTLSVLVAARDAGVRRVVNASSSSVYGDTAELPKRETMPNNPKSPYGLSKMAAESYARLFWEIYGLETISLRYFNVYGPRQNKASTYTAVIPLFVNAILNDRRPVINGSGEISRDFISVFDVVQANLLAAKAPAAALGKAYNIGNENPCTLLELVAAINRITGKNVQPEIGPARLGDVLHSFASIDAARKALGFEARVPFEEGLRKTVEFYASAVAV